MTRATWHHMVHSLCELAEPGHQSCIGKGPAVRQFPWRTSMRTQASHTCKLTTAVQAALLVGQLIRAMYEQPVSVCRAVQSTRLVPGDVLVLLPGPATCDMVLLRGSCLVQESLLSGEARQSVCLSVLLCLQTRVD